jgi:hypothetical protein
LNIDHIIIMIVPAAADVPPAALGATATTAAGATATPIIAAAAAVTVADAVAGAQLGRFPFLSLELPA